MSLDDLFLLAIRDLGPMSKCYKRVLGIFLGMCLNRAIIDSLRKTERSELKCLHDLGFFMAEIVYLLRLRGRKLLLASVR